MPDPMRAAQYLTVEIELDGQWLVESKIELDSPWFFESIAADGSHVTYNITHLPFRVGRDKSNDLTVASRGKTSGTGHENPPPISRSAG